MKSKMTILIILLIFILFIGWQYVFSSVKNFFMFQNISKNVKDICKEKSKIVCKVNCLDGFSEYCYFDTTKYKKDELKIENYFDEIKQVCIGLHSLSVCGECQNKFELKKNGEFRQVSCEEFFQTIENKNKTCSGCIDVITTGCC